MSHYVTGSAHPRSLTLQRRRRPCVLGRFINDTWPAPAGVLHRPIRPRFLGSGRVLGQTQLGATCAVRDVYNLRNCVMRKILCGITVA